MSRRKLRMAKRSCGGCTACCTALEVKALRKPAGEPCPKALASGCGCYRTRPMECAAYRCAWLQGCGGNEDRPDRCGVLVDVAEFMGAPSVRVMELREGAYAPKEAELLAVAKALKLPLVVHPFGAPAVGEVSGPAPEGSRDVGVLIRGAMVMMGYMTPAGEFFGRPGAPRPPDWLLAEWKEAMQ